MHYEPDPIPPPTAAAIREQVSMPGIFLAVVGVINILAALYLLFSGFQASKIDPDEYEKQVIERWFTTQQRQELKQEGWTAEKILSVTSVLGYLWGGVALVGGLLSTLGGIRMVKLRSYGLAVTGAILAAIPFLSPLGCCLIGEVVGIWSLVVLFNADVRMAFSAGSPPPEGGPISSSPFPP